MVYAPVIIFSCINWLTWKLLIQTCHGLFLSFINYVFQVKDIVLMDILYVPVSLQTVLSERCEKSKWTSYCWTQAGRKITTSEKPYSMNGKLMQIFITDLYPGLCLYLSYQGMSRENAIINFQIKWALILASLATSAVGSSAWFMRLGCQNTARSTEPGSSLVK